MLVVDDLLRCDLDEAAAAAAEEMPDVVAALDLIVPRLARESSVSVLRRYYATADAAIRTVFDLPAAEEHCSVRRKMAQDLTRDEIPALLWLAPTPDGMGFTKVVVDRLRGHFGNVPGECVRTRDGIDEHRFEWIRKALAGIVLERKYAEPLQRSMAILQLTSTEVGEIMGVSRQAVDRWLRAGPPTDRLEKIGALAEIADILHYRLREGTPPFAVRMKSETYEDRNILEVFADDDHIWLLDLIRWSFDFNDVA